LSCKELGRIDSNAPPHSLIFVPLFKPTGGETHISGPHHAAYLLHRIQIWAQPTVHREYLLINNGSNGQTIEAIRERFPKFDVVSSLAFIIEAINTIDGGTLMITPQNKEIFWVFDLVRQKEADCFQRLFTTVNVIA
jgi:hypothetical protein